MDNKLANIKKNLVKIRNDIIDYEKKYHRIPGSVTLVAVSKTQPIEKIKMAYEFGQIHFGENYLQEALPKIKTLTSSNIIWHYIGKIQSNKIKLIARNFSWAETITNYETAKLLNKYRPLDLPPLDVCIQVNVSKEFNKAGVAIEEIASLAQKIMHLPALKLRGLMTIPAYTDNFEQQFKTFDLIAQEFKRLQQQGIKIDTLSMGMSSDFAAAIAAGATIVRIGTAIFGERK